MMAARGELKTTDGEVEAGRAPENGMTQRLLLLSNSSNHGRGYLDHAIDEIADFFSGVRRVAFVPFALHDQEAYGAKAAARLAAIGTEVTIVREDASGAAAIESADAIFVGGGNTFRLLDKLHRSGLIKDVRGRAMEGAPYLGSSAGTVIAAPTIKTTNDMPIVQPPTLASLGLVPFQINCHYLDPDPDSKHMGETRETRILEFLEENDATVVGVREGGWLRVEGGSVRLKGARARIFSRGREPMEYGPDTDLGFLMGR